MKKIFQCLALIIVTIMSTSCQVMPVEEELPAAPVIRAYEAKEYEQTNVLRGDMILDKTVKCTYVSAKKEQLSFALGGVYIDKIYVSEGQQVQAGELLAQLELGDISEQIADREYAIQVQNAGKSNLLEQQELELKKQDAIIAGMEEQLAALIKQMSDCDERAKKAQISQEESALVQQEKEKLTQQAQVIVAQKQEQEKQRENIQKSYEKQLLNADDALYIAGLRLEELKEKLKERQIYAGISGIVTYAQKVKEGERSIKGRTCITVADLDTNVFTVKGEDAQYFPIGTEVTILCNKKELAAYAVDPTELGLTQQQEEEPAAYFQLQQPDPTLEDGVKGSIQIILDQRNDVLYVNKKAVKTANGESFVYMLDKKGLRIMQKVTTGLESGENIEITDGLAEGSSVIIE